LRICGNIEGIIELLHIIEQQLCQWTIDRLLLADYPLFKIKAALPPSKNFRQSSFAFQRSVDGMPNLPLMNIDLAVTASRFKGKASAALNHAGHLQNIGRRKLVQISN